MGANRSTNAVRNTPIHHQSARRDTNSKVLAVSGRSHLHARQTLGSITVTALLLQSHSVLKAWCCLVLTVSSNNLHLALIRPSSKATSVLALSRHPVTSLQSGTASAVLSAAMHPVRLASTRVMIVLLEHHHPALTVPPLMVHDACQTPPPNAVKVRSSARMDHA